MSQMFKTFMAGTAVVAIASVVLAQAPAADSAATQPKAVPTQLSVFQKMDGNGDGKATREEYQARLAKWFKELDKNGDGKLTADEFGGLRFTEIDLNKDGTITMEEYLVAYVGKDALAKAETALASDTLYPKDGGEVTGVEVVGYRKSVFKAIDANNDGKVTADEMKAYTDKEFTFLDKNKDGFVMVDEITAMAVVPVFAPKAAEQKPAAPAEK
jgi:Ca2+-binding EF-hand superfamily protein